MPKLIGETLVSLDGVIENPADWVGDYFDDAFVASTFERLRTCDAIRMGRRTYEILERDWASKTGEYSDVINEIPKYVFSSTLERADWKNAIIVKGDVAAEVAALKARAARDLTIWGHGLLAQTLLAHGLLEELRLSLFPVIVGRGQLLFRAGETAALELLETLPLPTGTVVLRYRPKP